MFNLDTFRLIRKTFKRFLSLALIVMIGAGFMMGMLSTPDIMRVSVDAYFDEKKMQDLQLYSSYGFSIDDVKAVREIEDVDTVFPSKTIDCMVINSKGDESVARISEINRAVNGFTLIEGRMPERTNECIVLSAADFENFVLGETLTLDYGDQDIDDFLENSVYTIVGFFNSPEYMARVLGDSNYKNRSLEDVIFVPTVNFKSDYYTTMYVTLKDSADLTSYTKAYDRFVEKKITNLETETASQQNRRRDQLIAEAQEQLDEKTELFNSLKSEGQKQLDDAKKQLDDARVTIASYEAQLTILTAAINALQAAMRNDQGVLQDIYNGTAQLEADLSNILTMMGLKPVNFGTSAMEYLYNEFNKTVSQFNSVQGQLVSAKAQYEQGLIEYEQAVEEFDKEMADAELQLRLAQQTIDELPKATWMFLDRSRQYSALMYKNTIDQMGSIGTYLPLIFFLVAALVCLTTMKRLVDEQRGQIGIFVALGYSELQIIGKYVLYALIASLTGGIIGAIIGQLLFPSVIYNTWRMMYSSPPMKVLFPIGNLRIAVLSFTVIMCGLTAYVVKDTVKEVPAALMRPKAPKKGKEIFLEKIPFIWNNLSFTSKITARNIFRYKSRFLMIIVGIAGCTGLLVLGFGIKDSVSGITDVQYGEIFNYDYQVYLDSSDHIDENVEILKADRNNDYVAPYQSYMTRVYLENDEDIANMIVLDTRDANEIFHLRETDKKTPIKLNNSGLVVSERFAQNNDIKQGDYITLESASGIKAEVQVSNICEMYVQHYIFMSDALYKNVFEEESIANTIAVTTENKDSLVADCARLQDFSSLNDFASFTESISSIFDALNLIISVIILVAGALAFVVLVNLTQVNISEREREIATLKVLGFNAREVDMYIFKEIMLLSLLGGLVGLPIGVIEHHMIMKLIAMEMIMFGMEIHPISYVYAYMITVIFTVIVLFFMRKPLQDVDMIESLKSVE